MSAYRCRGGPDLTETLAPALRLGWLVAPRDRQGPLVERRRVTTLAGSTIDHLALARLLQTGDYERHVRRMRSVYASRRRHLIDELGRNSWCRDVDGVEGGLHLLVRLSAGIDENRVVTALRHADLAVTALSECRVGRGDPPSAGVVVGFSTLTTDAVSRLVALIG